MKVRVIINPIVDFSNFLYIFCMEFIPKTVAPNAPTTDKEITLKSK